VPRAFDKNNGASAIKIGKQFANNERNETYSCVVTSNVQVERSKNWSTPPNVDAQKQYFRGFLPPILSRQTSKNTN
jgi:hypothetical protein